MGNVVRWMWSLQPTEIRVIYVKEHGTDQVFAVEWPETYAQFVSNLYEIFPAMKQIGRKHHVEKNHVEKRETEKHFVEKPTLPKCVFKDASEFTVSVVSESTFRGLTPCHKQIAPTVNLYYITLNSWVVH